MLKLFVLLCGMLVSVISYAQTLKIFRCEIPGTGRIQQNIPFFNNYDYQSVNSPLYIETREGSRARAVSLWSNISDTAVERDVSNKIQNNIDISLDFSAGGRSLIGKLSCSNGYGSICTPTSIVVNAGLRAEIFNSQAFRVYVPIDSTGFGIYREIVENPEFTVPVDDLYEFSDIEVSMKLVSGVYNVALKDRKINYQTYGVYTESPVVCKSAGTRLTFFIDPDVVDFGNVSAGQAETVSRNVSFHVTSGTSVPNGTIKFESASANGYDLPLGTGKLNMFNNTGTRLQFNTPYPVNSRNEDFTVVLYPADVTNFGLSETSVTVVLTIN